MHLTPMKPSQVPTAMEIIDGAKAHLNAQGIDQWQAGYPDLPCLERDAEHQTGYFVQEGSEILGYLCIDFDGEPAYETLQGTWANSGPYVVVHRMAFTESARGKGISQQVFSLVEAMSAQKGIYYFRVDTDGDNTKMQHVLKKCGFTYRGTIWFDNSEKIAFDKSFF